MSRTRATGAAAVAAAAIFLVVAVAVGLFVFLDAEPGGDGIDPSRAGANPAAADELVPRRETEAPSEPAKESSTATEWSAEAAGESDPTEVSEPVRRTVRGRILDPEGRPLAGATVRAIPGMIMDRAVAVDIRRMLRIFSREPTALASGTSDATGSFRLECGGEGPIQVQAWAPGFTRETSPSLDLEPGFEEAGLEIILLPGGAIVGRIVDPGGHGIAGAWAALLTSDKDIKSGMKGPSVRAGDDGVFRFDNAALRGNRLSARAPGFVQRSLEGIAAGGEEIQVVLEPAILWEGRVLARGDEAPIPGADVTVLQFTKGSVPALHETATDAAGRFRFDSIEPGGELMVMVEMDGWILDPTMPDQRSPLPTEKVPGDRVGPGPMSLDLHVKPRGEVSGLLVDQRDGRPVEGLAISLRSIGAAEARKPSTAAPSAADGSFHFPQAPGGWNLVELHSERWTVTAITGVEKDKLVDGRVLNLGSGEDLTGVRVELLPRIEARGRVVDVEGQPVSGARLRAVDAAGTARVRGFEIDRIPPARSAADGSFRLVGMSLGTSYAIRADLGERVSETTNWKADLDSQALELVLQHGAGIVFTLLLPDGRPATGQGLRLQALDDPFRSPPARNGRALDPATIANGAGEIRFDALPPGAYLIHLSAETGQLFELPEEARHLSLRSGETLRLPLSLVERWALTGIVRDRDGAAVRNVVIRATSLQGKLGEKGTRSIARSDREGRFRLADLNRDHDYRIECNEYGRPDGKQRRATIEVHVPCDPVEIRID